MPVIEIRKFWLQIFCIRGKTASEMQCHALGMTPKNWEFGEFLSPDLKFSWFYVNILL